MENFAENFNLGNRVRPPLLHYNCVSAPSLSLKLDRELGGTSYAYGEMLAALTFCLRWTLSRLPRRSTCSRFALAVFISDPRQNQAFDHVDKD